MTAPRAAEARAVARNDRHEQVASARCARLQDVSIQVPAGSFHALLGENGAGKSTLVKCIMGFYTPDRGKLLLDGSRGRRAQSAATRKRWASAWSISTSLSCRR